MFWKLNENDLEPIEKQFYRKGVEKKMKHRPGIKKVQQSIIWRHFFEIEQLKRKSKNGTSVEFVDIIVTDGVVVSVQMTRRKQVFEHTKAETQAYLQLKLTGVKNVYGFDPGAKLMITGIKRIDDSFQDNIRYSYN